MGEVIDNHPFIHWREFQDSRQSVGSSTVFGSLNHSENFAVNSVVLAIANGENFKTSMEELRGEIERRTRGETERLKTENYE